MSDSVATVWLADAVMRRPAYWAAARERAMEVRIVAPVRVPVGTAPISVPVTMVLIMLLREAGSATSHRAEKRSRDYCFCYRSHGQSLPHFALGPP